MNDPENLQQHQYHKARIAQLGRIGVLMGGCSSERSISCKSGNAIFHTLEGCGCNVVELDIKSLDEITIATMLLDSKINVAFIALHGRFGEDGAIQTILKRVNIPYTGSGVEASRRAINKITAQRLFKKNSLPVPKHIVVCKNNIDNCPVDLNEFSENTCIVKPSNEGSSIGITIVDDLSKLQVALNDAFQYDDEVIIEDYIEGREITVGILGDKALPVVEIKPKKGFFDFSAKYQLGATEYFVPANISPMLTARVQALALKAHQILGCRDMSRVDFILDNDNNPYILEVNTIPGFTETSLLPKAAQAVGITFQELCLALIELAYEKQKDKK